MKEFLESLHLNMKDFSFVLNAKIPNDELAMVVTKMRETAERLAHTQMLYGWTEIDAETKLKELVKSIKGLKVKSHGPYKPFPRVVFVDLIWDTPERNLCLATIHCRNFKFYQEGGENERQ